MTWVPPPGHENVRGTWGAHRRDLGPPQQDDSGEGHSSPLDPLSRRPLQLAGALSVLLVLLVAVAWLHGSSDTSLNPIAQAAQRTEGSPGARMAIRATYTTPGKSLSFTMQGHGVFNGRTHRSRVEMSIDLPGRRLEVEAVSDRHRIYTRSPLFAHEIPPGKRWIGTEPYLGHDPEKASICSCDLRQQLRVLKTIGGDVEEEGEETVRGVTTTRYRGTIEIDRVVSRLREQGKSDLAVVIERSMKGDPSIPVEVWVDDEGLLRRMRQVQNLPAGQGGSKLRMDLRMTLHDYGLQPRIELPPASDVFDATPLVQAKLGLLGKRAGRPTANLGPPLSPASFREKARGICRNVNREADELEKRSEHLTRRASRLKEAEGLDSPETRRAYQQVALIYFEPLIDLADATVARLERLSPPARLADRYQRYLDTGALQVEVVRALARAMEVGEFDLVPRLLKRLEKLTKQLKKRAQAVGTSVCEDD